MSTLAVFLEAAETGDEAARDRAYTEMLRFVRIVVRAEMGRKLRDHRESADVCQSIAKSFVDDVQAGRVEFESERALAAYLRLAVRNKLAELARHDGALKRGGGERERSIGLVGEIEGSASDSISGAEWTRLRSTLDEEERQLCELRMRGLEWEQVAAELELSGPVVRKRFSRIVRRLRDDHAGG